MKVKDDQGPNSEMCIARHPLKSILLYTLVSKRSLTIKQAFSPSDCQKVWLWQASSERFRFYKHHPVLKVNFDYFKEFKNKLRFQWNQDYILPDSKINHVIRWYISISTAALGLSGRRDPLILDSPLLVQMTSQGPCATLVLRGGGIRVKSNTSCIYFCQYSAAAWLLKQD